MATNGNGKVAIFSCKKCNYNTSRKSSLEKHFQTIKHLSVSAEGGLSTRPFSCKVCNNVYKDRTGLWKHNKKCVESEKVANLQLFATFEKEPDKQSDLNLNNLTNLIIDVTKQNQELQKQNQEFQKQILDIMQNNVGSKQIVNTINNNNQFNLNFFLNETCKDAMNIYQFMESIQIQLDDLDYTGENGYVAGVSRIFLRELKKLDVCKRPIHCTDVKREVFHVKNKDNHWGKERNLLITAIKEITRKNVVHLNEWREAYPGCMDYFNKKNNQYLKIQSEILGSADSEEDLKFYNKIISTVAKETMLDKKNMMTITECD